MITFTNSVFMAKITAFPTPTGLGFLITLTKLRWMILNLMPVTFLPMSITFLSTGFTTGSVALRHRRVTCCFFMVLPDHVIDPKSLPSPALSHRCYRSVCSVVPRLGSVALTELQVNFPVFARVPNDAPEPKRL